VAEQDLIVRRGDGRAVRVRAGQTINATTLRQAEDIGDAGAYFQGDSLYTQNIVARQQLQQVQRQGQQFGLPPGDPRTTMRGKFAEFMGSPWGVATQVAAGAIPTAAVGAAVAGPVGAVVGGLAGAGLTGGAIGYQKYLEHAYGLAEAQKKFDDSWFGTGLKWLDVPRQWLEQVIGAGAQLAADPEDTWKNLGSAWQAARLTYEAAPVDVRSLDPMRYVTGRAIGPINTSTLSTFVDYDVPEATGGVAALAEARKRIAGGENADNVYAEMQGRYGAPGQIRELLSGFLLDPLNFAEPVENAAVTGVARLGRFRTLEEAARLARTRGMFSGGLVDTIQNYKNLKGMQLMREGFTDARNLSRFQRVLLGEEITSVLDGRYTPPRPWEFWRLTPESMAVERINQASNYLQAHLTGALPLDENFPQESARILQGIKHAELGGPAPVDPAVRAMLTLEGQVVQRALRHGGDVELDLLKGWVDLADERALLDDLARRLNQTPAQIIQRATSGDTDALLRLYQQAGGQTTLSARAVADSFKAFADGAPYNVEQYRAALMAGLLEQTGKWSADFFQVKAPGFLQRLTGTVKAVQSAVLLGLNPGYLINNILNNEITLMARGAWGMRGLHDVTKDLERLGLSPGRLAQGVGAADVGESARGAALWGRAAVVAGDAPVAKAREVTGGLARVTETAQRITGAMPFTRWAQKAERWYSVRAYGEGFFQMWRNVWKRGVGFDELPPALAAELSAIDPRLPDYLYAAIEGGANPVDIYNSVFGKVQRPTVGAYVRAAAQATGIPEDEFRALVGIGGLDRALDAALADLPADATPADVRRVFQDVRVRAEESIAEAVAAEARANAEHVANAAGGGDDGLIDPGALLEHFDNARLRLGETFLAHKRLLEEIWSERLAGRMAKDEFVRRYRDAGDRLYRRGYFVEEDGIMDGLERGQRAAGMPLDDGFLLAKRSQHDNAQSFFRYKESELDAFFALPDEARTDAQWQATQQRIDAAYANLTGQQQLLAEAMDDYLAAAYETRFPGSGERVRAWRELVRRHDADYTGAVVAQFENARKLTDPQSRHRLWREFDHRMLAQRQAWTAEEIAARKAIWETVPGQRALDEGVAARQAPPVDESPTPPAGGRDVHEPRPQAALEPAVEPVAGVPAPEIVQAVEATAELQRATDRQALAAEFHALDQQITAAGEVVDAETVARWRALSAEYYAAFPDQLRGPAPPLPETAVTWNVSTRRAEIRAAVDPERERLLAVRGWKKEKTTGNWYKRGDVLDEGRRLVGEQDLNAAEAQALDKLRAEQLPEIRRQEPAGAPTLDDAIRNPRSELPPALSDAIEQQARELLRQVRDGQPGERILIDQQAGEVITDPSTYPDWYGALNTRRQTVLNALQKIVDDAGKDKDRAGQSIIRKMKEIIIRTLAETDPQTGRPPEPEVLRWLGRPQAEIDAAVADWYAAGAEPQVKPFTPGESALMFQPATAYQRFVDAYGQPVNIAAGDGFKMHRLLNGEAAEVVHGGGDVWEVYQAGERIGSHATRAAALAQAQDVNARAVPSVEYVRLDRRGPLSDNEIYAIAETPGLYGATEEIAALTPDRIQARRRAIADAEQLRLPPDVDSPLPPAVVGAARERPAAATAELNRPARGLLGSIISKDFVDQGVTSLVGHRPETAGDLAVLAQVYRNPRFETLRYFFTRGDKIVGQVGISARIPGMTQGLPSESPDDVLAGLNRLEQMMRDHEADGYWIVHNHPSGAPEPSDGDLRATDFIASNVDGFKGHVIINDTQYTVLTRAEGKVQSEMFDLPSRPAYMSRDPRNAIAPHPLLGRVLENADDMAVLAKDLQPDGDYITLVSIGAQSEVRGLMELSPRQHRTPERALASSIGFARSTGGVKVVVVLPPGYRMSLDLTRSLREGIRRDILLDAVYHTGDGWFSFRAGSSLMSEPRFGFGKLKTETRFTVGQRQAELFGESDSDQLTLFQPQTPYLLPPGVMSDNGAMPTPHAAAHSETYYRQLRPALAELQRLAEEDFARGRVKIADLPPETSEQLSNYVRAAGGRMSEAKLLAMKWGEYKRDSALLNYSRRYQFDTYLGMIAPYEFWTTHSMIKWALHSLQRPAIFAHYYRVNKFLSTSVSKPGFPSRLMGRVKIPLPFLPEWMGGGVWVDPLKLGLPIETFGAPWEQYSQRQVRLEAAAERELQAMKESGEITDAQLNEALGHAGSTWTLATQRVVEKDQSLRFDGADLATSIFSPSLPLKWAYEALRGTPERIGPLPITRDVRNLTAALGWGGPGGVNLESGLRRELKLPIFDQWTDYRVDRELANMAAEGKLTAEQAQAAMIERAGPAFDEAVRREAQQGGANVGVQVFGRLFAGAGVYPEGEQKQRELSVLWRAALKAQDDGDTDALNRFFELHPEYEARLALNAGPDERLRNFLVDQVWASYRALPTLYRQQVQAQLGPEFAEAFLDSETRSYDSISPATLATWARTLGRYVPGDVDGEPLDLDLAPEQVAYEAQQFYDERAARFDYDNIRAAQTAYFDIPEHARATTLEMPESVDAWYTQKDRLFPGINDLLDTYYLLPENAKPDERERRWPGIGALLDSYFSLPQGSQARRDFRNANPQLVEYWNWEKQYDAEHPENKKRAEFREQFPVIERYFKFKDAYMTGHPEAKAYLDDSDLSARSAFLSDNPDLSAYWDWRRAWLEAHPVTAAWITERAPGYDAISAPQEQRGAAINASPQMQQLVGAYLFAGAELPPRVKQSLTQAWRAQGEPGGSLDGWLVQVLAFGGDLGGASAPATGGYSYPRTLQRPGGQPPALPQPAATRPQTTTPVPIPAGAIGPTPPRGDRASGWQQWADMARAYGQQYGIPPELMLAALQAESGGNAQIIGDGGESVGLFQLHARGMGAGYSVEQRMNPQLQFDIMAPAFARSYQAAQAQGYTGHELIIEAIARTERPRGWENPNGAARNAYRRALAMVLGGT
jgi:hypothetical protein